jgi:tetratricopeptide (TPR) repeat protein
MREEEWSVFSYADLLVRIFRALANEYPQERLALSAFADRLMRLPVKEGEAVGEAKLLEWLGERLLLLIVENINDLFAGMGEAGQQALRAFLQNHSRALLLTTSPALTPDLSAHDSPFYGYFNVTHLKELTREEARQLLHKIATMVEHDNELANYLQTEEADRRLRVIELLAGGHPRIWILFSGCMSRQNLDELVPLFLKMLDDLTPYYQDRMRALPPQERRLIAYLCERSGAIPVKEIAEDCRLKPNHAAALLGKLEEKGYVRKAPEPTAASVGDRRIAYYEIREPLMRLCIEVKENRAAPLRLIVEFLRCWFSKEVIQERLNSLPLHAALTRFYLEAALKRQREVSTESAVFMDEGFRHSSTGNLYKALEDFNRVTLLEPDNVFAWICRGIVLAISDRWEESLESVNHAIWLNPHDTIAWTCRGLSLCALMRWAEALESFDRAFAIKPENSELNFYRARCFASLQRFDEAHEALENALASSADKKADALPSLANGLMQTIRTLLSEMMTDTLAQDWLASWEAAAQSRPQMDVALRLLRTAVEWKRTRDRGVLLRLASEERAVLEEILPHQ